MRNEINKEKLDRYKDIIVNDLINDTQIVNDGYSVKFPFIKGNTKYTIAVLELSTPIIENSTNYMLYSKFFAYVSDMYNFDLNHMDKLWKMYVNKLPF
jgi:hypothetical protein